MGSKSDLPIMQQTVDFLQSLQSSRYFVVSAHRTPERMLDYAKTAKKQRNKSHYCRSWRSCTSPWYGGELHHFTSYRSAYFIL